MTFKLKFVLEQHLVWSPFPQSLTAEHSASLMSNNVFQPLITASPLLSISIALLSKEVCLCFLYFQPGKYSLGNSKLTDIIAQSRLGISRTSADGRLTVSTFHCQTSLQTPRSWPCRRWRRECCTASGP